ncbi:MAG: hypothetical protein DSY81_12270 [Bacillota bacterium]|nr:MAG: hypothetical protein DSY92_05025 [Planctomycetota bacterium]RUA07544.1 MAG: hypothetical protein DSY81_12270 [Bacillota bacterium]
MDMGLMKRWFPIWMLASVLGCLAAVPADLLASNGVSLAPDGVIGEVTSVTLYSRHARVERTLAVAAGEVGLRSMQIGPLPYSIIDSSIEIEGTAGLSSVSVQVNRSSGEPVESEAVQANRRLLKEREQKLLALQRKDQSLQQMRSRFARILPQLDDEDETSDLINLVKWQGMLDLVQQGMLGAARSRDELAPQLRESMQQVEQTRRELDELIDEGLRSRAVINAGIQDLTGEGGVIRVRYLIPRAFWYPHYEVDVDAESGTMQLRAFAIVKQSTGEDWPEVPVHFSTSTPEQGSDLPELASLILKRDRYLAPDDSRVLDLRIQARPRMEARRALKPAAGFYTVEDLELSFAEVDKLGDMDLPQLRGGRGRFDGLLDEQIMHGFALRGIDEKQVMQIAAPTQLLLPMMSNRGFLRVFQSVKPEAIPSDGQSHRLLYSVKNLNFTEERLCIPELSLAVFRRIIASLSGTDPLLRGTVSVFLGEDYLGQAVIDTTAPGENLELDLGVDGQLVVERIQRESEDEIGLFSKAALFDTDLELTVSNYHTESVKLLLRERIPFTESDSLKIRIDRTKSVPLPEGLDSDDGLLSWEIELQAGESEQIRLKWSIEAPVDVELLRREAPERSGQEGR